MKRVTIFQQKPSSDPNHTVVASVFPRMTGNYADKLLRFVIRSVWLKMSVQASNYFFNWVNIVVLMT